MRRITHHYRDPLEIIWLHAAAQMGLQVQRSSEVFAAWDGQGTLTIGSPETLDPDDSLAQMILHECCHALVEGPDAVHLPDWGVQIDNPAHRIREHATLRLQAALTNPFGLRQFFAATTTFRRYYDQLPPDPLQTSDNDPAVPLAQIAWQRSQTGPWAAELRTALTRTAQIAEIVQPAASQVSLWSAFQPLTEK